MDKESDFKMIKKDYGEVQKTLKVNVREYNDLNSKKL